MRKNNMRKVKFILLLTFHFILLMTLSSCNKNDSISTLVEIENKTDIDLQMSIDISLGFESNSSSQNIFSLNKIEGETKKTEKITLENQNEDYAFIIKIDDALNTYYFTSSDNLSHINVILKIDLNKEGGITVSGNFESKQKFGTKKVEEIKAVNKERSSL